MTAAATWLILGGSSAIGRAFAIVAAQRGYDVLLAGRDMEDLQRSAADIRIGTGRKAEALTFDALALDTHAAFAADVAERTDTLNVTLLFAVMPEQDEMNVDPKKATQCVDGTLTGAVSILQHLALKLEDKGKGIVIGFGSVAGDRGRRKNYVYGAAKAGLDAYLSGLRNRLGRRGVHVVTVKPGLVDTAMTWGKPGLFLIASPADVARHCLNAAERKRNVLYVPWFWRWIMLIIRAIPESIFKKLDI